MPGQYLISPAGPIRWCIMRYREAGLLRLINLRRFRNGKNVFTGFPQRCFNLLGWGMPPQEDLKHIVLLYIFVEDYGNPVYRMPGHFQNNIEQSSQTVEGFKRVDARVKNNDGMVAGAEPVNSKESRRGRKVNKDIIITGTHNLYRFVKNSGLIVFVLYNHLGGE